MNSLLLKQCSIITNEQYYDKVDKDINEASKYYPWINEVYIPTVKPISKIYEIIVVNKNFIDDSVSIKDDFINEYSKKVIVIVPNNYPNTHCLVYGGNWIDIEKVSYDDRHFYPQECGLNLFCVGVPKSVNDYSNIILENLKTVENMLNAYELYQKGETNTLELLSYSHGKEGEREYGKQKRKNRIR